ncbi:NtaA/DmoA family FMN-dependent monooxygenase [Frondihabitans sp. PhB188]|uniref:NtaA/DmoA family FMN-dependent monooxygenase n=1 Tax=Frondihabitans sp. PhB188 TaxID=2485200 RepID=UPI0018F4DEA2|nr:NtaA/DmoA family FMN-dependent monooxygenase [Frondihabitans sp. PhB188]
MAWFLTTGFGAYGWNGQWSGNVPKDVGNPQLFVDLATSLERAGFDYMMLEDSSVLPDVFEGTPRQALETGVIRFDPMPLVPLLAGATKKLGIVATASTSFYPPFLAARLMTTLDHLTQGRVGINLVTSSPHAAAQNYGYDEHFEHDLRYQMADEWVDAVTALWDGWEEGALTFDEQAGVFADHTKVHRADFDGEFYKTRGPLNVPPGPQRHPVICQAGGSPAGMEFGARHADTIVAQVRTTEAAKAYRDDISARMIANGRDPRDVKVLFLYQPVLADTDAEAQAKADRMDAAAAANLDGALAGMSYVSGIDFSKYDLDAPIEDLTGKSNGHQSSVDEFARTSKGKTLRETLALRTTVGTRHIGSPDSVASQMEEMMQECGGDGFLVALPVTRKNITEVCDGLAPALRRRGLIRDSYDGATFRENLLAF